MDEEAKPYQRLQSADARSCRNRQDPINPERLRSMITRDGTVNHSAALNTKLPQEIEAPLLDCLTVSKPTVYDTETVAVEYQRTWNKALEAHIQDDAAHPPAFHYWKDKKGAWQRKAAEYTPLCADVYPAYRFLPKEERDKFEEDLAQNKAQSALMKSITKHQETNNLKELQHELG